MRIKTFLIIVGTFCATNLQVLKMNPVIRAHCMGVTRWQCCKPLVDSFV